MAFRQQEPAEGLINSPNIAYTCENSPQNPDFRVAIDFGTTYTSVAFVKGDNQLVETIGQYNKDRKTGRVGSQVPSEIWYPNTNTGNRASFIRVADCLVGYEALRHLERADNDPLRIKYGNNTRVTWPKLLFEQGIHVQEMRAGMMKVVERLKAIHLIKHNENVVEHYLTYVLAHVKSQLRRLHDFTTANTIELTFCVPVCWSAGTIALMSTCIQNAMKAAHFGTNETPRLFIVNEAEAAAMYAISSVYRVLNSNETFVMLDCGGGTTDVGTYTIAHEFPLRFGEEVNKPTGAQCGSTDLDQRMRQIARQHLSGELYLVRDGLTIEKIIERDVMPHFENEIKRAFDITVKEEKFEFHVTGLKASSSNSKLQSHTFVLTYNDMRSIFNDSLHTIEKLMVDQIQQAWLKGKEIDRVVLVGGFGDSPALQSYLKNSIKKMNKRKNTKLQQEKDIEFVITPANTAAAAVATGAVMRSQNKENGPKRKPTLSVGIIRHIPEDPEDPNAYSAEVLAQPIDDARLSERRYIKDTIMWIIKAGEGKIESVHNNVFLSEHEFGVKEATWKAVEYLYTSPTCVEDHFKIGHPKNSGKVTQFGQIEFDLTHLKKQIKGSNCDNGTDHYVVTLEIHFTVIDRHLEFTAYWYEDDESPPIRGNHAGFEISSIFQPGTA